MALNPYAPPEGPIIARMREHSEMSTGGVLAVIAMALVATLMVVSFLSDTSAIRGAAYGAVGTALIVLFGVCALLSRRRTYIVYREPPSE